MQKTLVKMYIDAAKYGTEPKFERIYYDLILENALKDITVGNFEADIKINMFRNYKDAAARMSLSQAYDIYYGVYIPYCLSEINSRVVCLFDDLYDWHRIDFAIKRIEHKSGKLK